MGFFSFIGDAIDAIGDLGQSIIDVAVDVVEGVGDAIVAVVEVAVDVVSDIIGWLMPDTPDFAIPDAIEYAGILVNKRATTSQVPIIYGTRKIGGSIVHQPSSGTDNEYLYYVVVLCEGEIHEIGDIYVNDILSTDVKYSGLLTINKHLGSDTQAADAMLVSAGVQWTSSHTLSGLAYLAVRFKWDQDVYGNLPSISAVVTGKKVHDTRTGSTATKANCGNPALCWRDYMTNARYGKGLPTAAIDDAHVSAAANDCDVTVSPYTGGTSQKIFECNAVLSTDKTVMNNTVSILSSMRGMMPKRGSKYSLIVEGESASVFDMTESHIIGGITIRSESKRTKFNRVVATFANPAKDWQLDQIEYPPAGSSEYQGYLSDDGGVELHKNISLANTTNIYAAQDLAKMVLLRSRNALVVAINTTSEGLNLTVGDVITVSHSTPSWVEKPFRVVKISLSPSGVVGLNLIEHQDSIYPWTEKDQASDVPDTNLPNPFNVIAPTATAVNEELYSTVNSKGIQSRATFIWSAPNDAFVNGYEAEYKLSSDSAYKTIGTTSALEVYVDDILPELYDFRVRAINTLGVRSAYSAILNRTIAGLTAVPQPLANLSVRALDGQCHLSWERITELDVINGGFVRIRHSELTSGAEWDSARDIGQAIAGNQSYTVLPLLAGTYLAKTVDSGGRFSTNAVNAVTTVPNIMSLNVVETLTESPAYTGTRDGMQVLAGMLVLDGADQGILLENGDFLQTESGDNVIRELTGSDLIVNSGTYNFSNYIDLGQIFTSRITGNLKSSAAVASANIDNRNQYIDDWQNFDGSPSNVITGEIQIRSTNDNPAGAPTWSDWIPLLVGDFHSRAFEFRLVVTNLDSTYNISVTELSVVIDMPDRTERAINVTTDTAGTAITFDKPFQATPSVGVTMQDSDSGDFFRVTSTSRTGFTVQCLKNDNQGISRSINWQAVGYGRGE
tara:strand:- start:1332 stop:4199 length:2868 start_codon:yes stop_codon:yes gene_type:complete